MAAGGRKVMWTCPSLASKIHSLSYAPLFQHQLMANVFRQQIMFYPTNKHWDIKWRKQRKEKFLKVNLPDFEKMKKEQNMSPDEIRIKMKKEGRLPPRTFQERPINISSTGSVFEPYLPPERDGKSSLISKAGAKQRLTELEKKGKSFMEIRKIRQFEDNFNTKEFALLAQDILIETQDLLENIKKNEDRLHQLVTEKAYPEMTHSLEKKSFRWKFIESIEPPRVVHIRTTEMLSKDNLYAQVTVRLHAKQCLAIYDRFGRLMYGSENLVKDVLEYIVLEKHISDDYGQWRIHGKIIPEWMPPYELVHKTYRLPNFEPIVDDSKDTDQSTVQDTNGGLVKPEVATA